MMGYDAIVIGAGIGGCAAGCAMAGSGMKVLILERMPEVGGRCSSIKRDGFTLDTGAHCIFGCEHGAIEEACKRVGKEGAIEWCHYRKMLGVFEDFRAYFDGNSAFVEWDDGEKITFHGMALAESMMEKVPTEFMDAGMNMMSKMMPLVIGMATPIIEQLDDVLIKDFMGKFIEWPRLSDMFNTLQCGMFGTPDWMTSTAELYRTVLGMMEYYKPGMDPLELAGFPKGGLLTIPATMCEGIKEKGGEVRTGANVKRVVVEGGKVAGVELDDGEVIKAPVVVSNSGIKETVADLVGREHFDPEYADEIKDLKTGTSGYCIRIALDAPVTDADMGGLLMAEPGRMQGYFQEMWTEHVIPDDPPPVYWTVPSNMDPSLAPPGKQIIVGIGPLMFDSKDPYSKLEKLALDAFSAALPGFKEHLMWHDFLDPAFYSALGERLAPAIGLAQCIGQVGKKRPSSVSPLEGLYYCGGDAGTNISGMACDMCVKSGIACGDYISSESKVGSEA